MLTLPTPAALLQLHCMHFIGDSPICSFPISFVPQQSEYFSSWSGNTSASHVLLYCHHEWLRERIKFGLKISPLVELNVELTFCHQILNSRWLAPKAEGLNWRPSYMRAILQWTSQHLGYTSHERGKKKITCYSNANYHFTIRQNWGSLDFY